MTTKKTTTTTTNTRTLAERMFDAMTQLDFIAKDKTNDFHRYKYASEYAIKEAVHAELVRNRILFSMSFRDIMRTDGSQLMYVIYDYKFTNVDDTSDTITGSWIGSGEDKGDKALYKATTGAIKYLLTSMFLIPTGDDPEVDNTQPVRTASTPQVTRAGVITPNVKTDASESVVAKPRKSIRISDAKQTTPTPTTPRPRIEENALVQYCWRIEKGDATIYDRVLEYYNCDEAQVARLKASLDKLNAGKEATHAN